MVSNVRYMSKNETEKVVSAVFVYIMLVGGIFMKSNWQKICLMSFERFQ
jgi:hypothetical protein